MAKIRVRETFEQGLERKHGGMLKLVAGEEVDVGETVDGLVPLVRGSGRPDRRVPKEIYDRWHQTRLVELLVEG